MQRVAFSQRSWSDDDEPLNRQIEKWLQGKKFSYFKPIHNNLVMDKECSYLYTVEIYYELESENS